MKEFIRSIIAGLAAALLFWFIYYAVFYVEKTKLEIEKLKYEISLYKENSENK